MVRWLKKKTQKVGELPPLLQLPTCQALSQNICVNTSCRLVRTYSYQRNHGPIPYNTRDSTPHPLGGISEPLFSKASGAHTTQRGFGKIDLDEIFPWKHRSAFAPSPLLKKSASKFVRGGVCFHACYTVTLWLLGRKMRHIRHIKLAFDPYST